MAVAAKLEGDFYDLHIGWQVAFENPKYLKMLLPIQIDPSIIKKALGSEGESVIDVVEKIHLPVLPEDDEDSSFWSFLENLSPLQDLLEIGLRGLFVALPSRKPDGSRTWGGSRGADVSANTRKGCPPCSRSRGTDKTSI
ncbi:hypothetical protein U1Q18_043103 [Sarracenia purpurea var. burkii]